MAKLTHPLTKTVVSVADGDVERLKLAGFKEVAEDAVRKPNRRTKSARSASNSRRAESSDDAAERRGTPDKESDS